MPPLSPKHVHYCPDCAYPLHGLTSQGCPECGCDVSEPMLERLILARAATFRDETIAMIVLPVSTFAPTLVAALLLLLFDERLGHIAFFGVGAWLAALVGIGMGMLISAVRLAQGQVFEQ